VRSGASGLGKSVKNEVPAVDADGKPTFDLTNDYKEPVEVPMFLNLKKKSWEIIINEAHLNSTHYLVSKFRGMYWIRILKDFKRLFNYEKVLWYSIKTLCNFKKVLCYSIKILCHFKKVLRYSIKSFHHLKKVSWYSKSFKFQRIV